MFWTYNVHRGTGNEKSTSSIRKERGNLGTQLQWKNNVREGIKGTKCELCAQNSFKWARKSSSYSTEPPTFVQVAEFLDQLSD
jgi:hypothetical protein